MQIIFLILGLLVTILTFWDFFHTTISGNGFGPISLRINKLLARIILHARSKLLFHYSGFIHVLVYIFSLFLLLLLGSFLVFLGNGEMVIHEDTQLPATPVQRFYYICYLLSTAGFGKFVPGNATSDFFSSIYSFLGFILLTTSVTYLISVINSVLVKKELALYISGLGENISDLYHYFTVRKDSQLLIGEKGYLRQMINKCTSNLNTFPILCYFITRHQRYALILQLARLYEILLFLKTRNDTKNEDNAIILKSMLKTIENFLKQEEGSSFIFDHDKTGLKKLRLFWKKHTGEYLEETPFDPQMNHALQKAGWDWEDVYRNENREDSKKIKTGTNHLGKQKIN